MPLFFVGGGYRWRPPKMKPLDDIDQRLGKNTKGRKPRRRKPAKTKVKEMDRTRNIRNEDYMKRAEGPQTMWKDHARAEWSNKSEIEKVTQKVRSRVALSEKGTFQPDWVMVKLLEKILTTFGEDPNPTKVKRYESHTERLYKTEDGRMYRTKLELDHGVPNKYMKNSLKANGKKSIWFPQFAPVSVDGEAKARINYSGRAYSQAGANRQGFGHWGLTTSKEGLTINTADYLTPDNSVAATINPSYVYKYFGLPSYGMISNYFGDNGVTDKVRDFLNSSEFKKSMLVDLYTNIMSRFSVHTYYNAMQYTDVNIKLYVCRLKSNSRDKNIFNDICDFGNFAAKEEGYRIPQTAASRSASDATIIGMNVNENWFDAEKEDIRWADGSTGDPPVENVVPVFVELSTVLGLTPQQSQIFNAHWDVVDVIDNNLGPNDSWEFTIEEKYKKSFSIKKWLELMGNFSEQSEYDDYTINQKYTHNGDIVIVPVFSGSPSGNFELRENNTNEDLQVMPVDASPSRIRHNVRHGMSISWPKAIDVRTYTSSIEDDWENQGWNIVQQRSNFTGRANWPFGYENSRIRITTAANDEVGGPKSDV